MGMFERQANSGVVRGRIELCMPALRAAFGDLWRTDPPREMTIAFLVLLHQIMRASVPLMQSAAVKCDQLEGTDKLAPLLGEYYRHHVSEELHHDTWALEDLETAGCDPRRLLSITPSVEVARLVGTQYYWLHHHHPLMLLGYITVLEAFPPADSMIDEIRDRSGLPDSTFRTLRIHGDLDPTHSAEIDQTFDALPLDQEHLEMVGLSVLHSCDALAASVRVLRPLYLFSGSTSD
ncbi:iron-containing redox enzyme family protein [Ensifer sesbaniae]|uniref:iron-containing redox enzyme family protein n=1 Tax=Ensifer sesbaniae TaxID=1214071 RepID=UPI001568BFAF|nr:iron-containing redox enzyme family protein [Ensifer sesbaniae]